MREIRHCPICAGTDRDLVYPGTLDTTNTVGARTNPYSSHYQINRCRGCGLIFSSPIFEDADIAALYEKAPHGNVESGEEGNVKRTMRLYYELARPHLLQRDRLLDVGCDIGLMLEFARQDGFRELYGLEPNPIAREKAQAIPRAVVSERFYEEQEFPAASFDLITFIHVVDHLIDPSKAVERAFMHAKPGGLVVAVVHNVESMLARMTGERFPPFNLYHHYFFSERTLAALFESRGFDTVSVGSTKNCYSLGFFARRAPGIPAGLRFAIASGLDRLGIGGLPLTIPVGNIGIVARRPS
jgi:2-polyprenyl-3-methyl-5-hydroxy-6-metoxy-1,4-benzoquinol methylase